MTGAPTWLLPASAAAMAAVVVVGGSLVTAVQTQRDLRARACAALAEADLPGVAVTWSGRDATVAAQDDLGRLTSSVAVLSRVRGARTVTVGTGSTAVVGTCPGIAPAAGPAPAPAPGGAPSDAAARTVSVRFDTNSADLDAVARAQLDALVVWLRDHPATALHVHGHTDDTGFDARNLPLSFVRAGNVADYLRATGARAGTVDAVGHSSLQPLVPNVSAENRAVNRRADVVVEGSR